MRVDLVAVAPLADNDTFSSETRRPDQQSRLPVPVADRTQSIVVSTLGSSSKGSAGAEKILLKSPETHANETEPSESVPETVGREEGGRKGGRERGEVYLSGGSPYDNDRSLLGGSLLSRNLFATKNIQASQHRTDKCRRSRSNGKEIAGVVSQTPR